MPSYSGVWSLPAVYQAVAQGLWPFSPTNGPIGLFGGGIVSGAGTNTIDRVVIPSTGNASDFGDLLSATYQLAGCGSSVRGIFVGGTVAGSYVNVISYVTFAAAGNAVDFGDLISGGSGAYLSACSNYVRGVISSPYDGSDGQGSNVIQYITIASTGNATDFGDLSAKMYATSSSASDTRGLIGTQLRAGLTSNSIDYVTIASAGNSLDFGDLTVARYAGSSSASSTRSIFGGGTTGSASNIIDYVTIASIGNATDFGDLSAAVYALTSCASDTRSLFGGGYTGSVSRNVIEYVTIASTGNVTDFGDLSAANYYLASCSNAASAVQPTPTSAQIGMFLGGSLAGSNSYQITYVNIATTGNAYMWGSLASPYNPASGPSAVASSTRAVVGGGATSVEGYTNTIQYLTFSTFGDASDFGDLLGRTINLTSLSNSTRGVFAGGEPVSGGRQNVIQYVTIASVGNATDFGDLTERVEGPASCSSTTRGLVAGGVRYLASETNTIGYITIASTGDATDFGDLTVARNYFNCGGSYGTRGIFSGGQLAQSSASSSNVVDYVTIASVGNATDFGDLTIARQGCTTTSSTVRAITCGGFTGSTNYNIIDYVTIASTGNSIDFGDLVETIRYFASCSNAHGGL